MLGPVGLIFGRRGAWMSPLRQLCAIYLIVAGAYTAAIVLAHHPRLARAVDSAALVLRHDTARAARAANKYAFTPAIDFTVRQASLWHDKIAGMLNPPPPQIAAAPQTQSPKPLTVAARVQSEPQLAAGAAGITLSLQPPLRPSFGAPRVLPDTRQASLPPGSAGRTSTAEIDRVQQRLRDSLTSEMFDHFDLFLYVSKASKGPWAQHMFVFKKTGKTLAMLYDWPVSTGREQVEFNEGRELPSFTPRGYYELDPHRFYVHYTSMQWGEKMPYAMFFNWEKDGTPTGLAIHGAVGEEIGLLGERASAGCIRLAPENAAVLQALIRSKYAGLVPKFAYDKKTATMSNDGLLLHDTDGRLELTKGYRVLVFVENYGGQNVVAALF